MFEKSQSPHILKYKLMEWNIVLHLQSAVLKQVYLNLPQKSEFSEWTIAV